MCVPLMLSMTSCLCSISYARYCRYATLVQVIRNAATSQEIELHTEDSIGFQAWPKPANADAGMGGEQRLMCHVMSLFVCDGKVSLHNKAYRTDCVRCTERSLHGAVLGARYPAN